MDSKNVLHKTTYTYFEIIPIKMGIESNDMTNEFLHNIDYIHRTIQPRRILKTLMEI